MISMGVVIQTGILRDDPGN